MLASHSALTLLRRSSTSATSLSSLKLVAELRKCTTVSIEKAREALVASKGDIPAALKWLEKDRVSAGQRKAEKVGNRFMGEGLIGISVLSRGAGAGATTGVRAAMIELNCETDFVGRNELFRALTQDLALTAAFISEYGSNSATYGDKLLRPINLLHLRDAPLMVKGQKNPSKTVSEAIRDTITAVGENIRIRRAASFIHDHIPPTSGVGLRVSSYMHGALSIPPDKVEGAIIEAQGKIGALTAIGLKASPASRLRELLQHSVFESELSTLERALSRQIVGLSANCVGGDTENALYNQPFDMLTTSGGQSVYAVLKKWTEEQKMVEKGSDAPGLSVIEFLRWEVGEGL